MKAKILFEIRRLGHVSFVELSKLPGFSGDRALMLVHPRASNILLWDRVSRDGCDAIGELKRERLIEMRPAPVLVYLCDGKVLGYPIAKRARHYRDLRWAPVTLSATTARGKQAKP